MAHLPNKGSFLLVRRGNKKNNHISIINHLLRDYIRIVRFCIVVQHSDLHKDAWHGVQWNIQPNVHSSDGHDRWSNLLATKYRFEACHQHDCTAVETSSERRFTFTSHPCSSLCTVVNNQYSLQRCTVSGMTRRIDGSLLKKQTSRLIKSCRAKACNTSADTPHLMTILIHFMRCNFNFRVCCLTRRDANCTGAKKTQNQVVPGAS